MKKISFIGSKELGLAVFKQLCKIVSHQIDGCYTVIDRQDPRSSFDSIKQVAEKHGIRFIPIEKGNMLDDSIKNSEADFALMVGWYWLVKKQTIDFFPEGIIGIHNSLLPKYRGAAPFVWAILNGEEKTGISFFSLTEKMDEGKIWGQVSFSINERDTIKTLFEKGKLAATDWIENNIIDLLEGKKTPVNQGESTVSYGAYRLPKDGKINWNWTDTYINRFVRAQTRPYPGAFTFFEEERIKVWDTEVTDLTYYGTPGQVVFFNDDIGVITGNQKLLKITDIEFGESDSQKEQSFKGVGVRLS